MRRPGAPPKPRAGARPPAPSPSKARAPAASSKEPAARGEARKPPAAASAKARPDAARKPASPPKALPPEDPSAPLPPGRLVAIAEILRPHGVIGELRVKVYNEGSDLLEQRPPVWLRLPDDRVRAAKLRAVRPTTKAMLVELEGVADRDLAEVLRGARICVPRETFPPLDEGEFYACDVEGARALLPDGQAVGRVLELRSYPTCDVLAVEREGGPMIEVPLLDPYVERVDVEAGIVHLRTIDGLA